MLLEEGDGGGCEEQRPSDASQPTQAMGRESQAGGG